PTAKPSTSPTTLSSVSPAACGHPTKHEQQKSPVLFKRALLALTIISATSMRHSEVSKQADSGENSGPKGWPPTSRSSRSSAVPYPPAGRDPLAGGLDEVAALGHDS